MSVLAANRRALSFVSHQRSRLLHSSSASQAAILSPADLVEEETEEIKIPPIFDIFDAPTRLADSAEFIRARHETPAQETKRPSLPASSSSSSRPTPATLPPPIIFDGPARPRNEALAFRRRMRDVDLAHTPPPRPKQTPASRLFSSSKPLIQVFEGPARITRYHHPSSGDKKQQEPSKLIVAFGIAGGVVACGTLAKEYAERE
ncbi:hypothetical protein CPB84DRAFT_1846206 [Gymnopilus junonius]|uniref:Uncharacterized protein n=1 Tax=Gymnopilus junonius TaxID=109634 RepID=A0A9P5TN45_GYMJU|nr:hypothetical protein CPB84DRAFT_1846206 [Gymnopilus junonius]